MSAPIAVVAIGGNALIADSGHQSIVDQAHEVEKACRSIATLCERGWRVVVTHGNGPQVGFILRRSELAIAEVPPVPMEYATADTQGAIGFMFQRALWNEFAKRNQSREAITVVTQVLVDAFDPAFARPDKPIGQFYTAAEAETLSRRWNWTMVDDSGRGLRRVVASPTPRRILELDAIGNLVDDRRVVIACGGGGVPVVRGSSGELEGVEAVVDKDRTSALLAAGLGAQLFLICTAVDRVYVRYGKPDQRALETVRIAEALRYRDEGEFPAGSMGPKVEAILSYLETSKATDSVGAIGSLDRIEDVVEGRSGTRFIP